MCGVGGRRGEGGEGGGGADTTRCLSNVSVSDSSSIAVTVDVNT